MVCGASSRSRGLAVEWPRAHPLTGRFAGDERRHRQGIWCPGEVLGSIPFAPMRCTPDCPSGQRERIVNPSALPSLVRIHHLAPHETGARIATVIRAPVLSHLIEPGRRAAPTFPGAAEASRPRGVPWSCFATSGTRVVVTREGPAGDARKGADGTRGRERGSGRKWSPQCAKTRLDSVSGLRICVCW